MGGTGARSTKDVRERVAMGVHVDMSGRHVVGTGASVVVAEERLACSFRTGEHLDLRFVRSQVDTAAIKAATLFHLEREERSTLDVKRDPRIWVLTDARSIS